jgi:benzoyl-CoA reductase/2-hydroxyglutaryl-CoA dehydratase subunit BcrC/BadD/HgdB
MSEKGAPFRYPERIKEAFLASGDLTFGDGTTVSTAQMWEFLTEEGPRRFPAAFTRDPFSGGLSPDVDFLAGVKRYYWAFTGFDRFKARHKNGAPIVAVQAGSPLEIYYAARCLVVGPGFPVGWLLQQSTGLSREEMQRRLAAIRNECKKSMPAECCTIVAPFNAVHTSQTPIDFAAPITMTACSDAMFTIESARRVENNIPSFVVDFPVNHQAGSWRAEYLASQLRMLAARLGKLSGVTVTDEVMAAEIKRQNQLRRLARECTELWWNAEVPPANSGDRGILGMCSADAHNYPVVMQLLTEARAEIQHRLARGIRGRGLHHNPVRLFVCGSCAAVNAFMIEQAGGVVVGHEEGLSLLYMDTKEDGDPFMNMAEALCDLPYERPPEQRAAWTAQKVKESRADGVIFVYNWGCNYQSSISRMVTEIIKAQAGVPTLTIDISQSGQMTNAEQARTRIEAFMEILDRNRSVSRQAAFSCR